MDADHQKSAFASKRGVPKCPFGELYVLHFQTDDFFKTKFCGKQEYHHDIAFDELGDVLDSMIETGGMTKEEYQAKVKDFVCSL